MIKKLKRVIVEELEVLQIRKDNLLEVASFIEKSFQNDYEILEFRENTLKNGRLLIGCKIAYFGDYLVKDKNNLIKVLDELGYKQLIKQFENEENTKELGNLEKNIETKSEKEETSKEEDVTDEKLFKGMEDFINKIKDNGNGEIKVILDLGNKVFKDKILNDTALKENMENVKEILDKIFKK
jgi:hypothetical protein